MDNGYFYAAVANFSLFTIHYSLLFITFARK